MRPLTLLLAVLCGCGSSGAVPTPPPDDASGAAGAEASGAAGTTGAAGVTGAGGTTGAAGSSDGATVTWGFDNCFPGATQIEITTPTGSPIASDQIPTGSCSTTCTASDPTSPGAGAKCAPMSHDSPTYCPAGVTMPSSCRCTAKGTPGSKDLTFVCGGAGACWSVVGSSDAPTCLPCDSSAPIKLGC